MGGYILDIEKPGDNRDRVVGRASCLVVCVLFHQEGEKGGD